MKKRNIIILVLVIFLLISSSITFYLINNKSTNENVTEKNYNLEIDSLIDKYNNIESDEITDILKELELLKNNKIDDIEVKLKEYENKLEDIKNKLENEEIKEDEEKEIIDDSEEKNDEIKPEESKPTTSETTKPSTNTNKPSASETTKPSTNTNKPSTSETTKPSTDTSKPAETTTSTNEVKPASGIEALLNNASLNPLKTGYTDLDNKIQSIINNNTNSSMTMYQKVKALYDWEIGYMRYSYFFLDDEVVKHMNYLMGLSSFDTEMAATAYEAIRDKAGTCDSYAALFMVLTRRLGLDSYYVGAVNKDGTTHSTSVIRINGQYYDFDVQGEDKVANNGKIQYIYFGKSDSEISRYYSYINRDNYVKSFNYFKTSSILKASVTIGNVTLTGGAKDDEVKVQEVGEFLELNGPDIPYFISNNEQILKYSEDEPIKIKINSSENLKYYVLMENINLAPGYKSMSLPPVGKGTISTGEIEYLPQYPRIGYIHVIVEDSQKRTIIFVFKVNIMKKDQPFKLGGCAGNINSETGLVEFSCGYSNGTGPLTYTVSLKATTDPDYVFGYEVYQLMNKNYVRLTNLRRGYKYIYDVVATSADGQTDSTTVEEDWENY